MKIQTHGDFPILSWRVIDSDTIQAWIEVHHDVAIRHRVRLKGIEGGERGTAAGEANLLLLGTTLLDRGEGQIFFVGSTHHRDNHGRIVGDIRLACNSLLCQTLLNTGRYWRRSAYADDPNNKGNPYG